MSQQCRAGIPAHLLQDNVECADDLRRQIIGYSERYVKSLQGDALLSLSSVVSAEMEDDPLWSEENDASFTWDKYHEYMARPRSYATFYLLATWVRTLALQFSGKQMDNLP